METHHEDRNTNRALEKNHGEEETLKEQLVLQESKTPASSPSHEFSFTISLHSSQDKSRPPPASFAVDLSPADDIFFHGHLLPLHFLSHLPVSPRSSNNSLDSFTLPIKDSLDDQRRADVNICCNATNGDAGGKTNKHHNHHRQQSEPFETKPRSKLKSLSFFGLKRWQRKAEETEDQGGQKHKRKRKLRFDMSQVLKRYARFVRPLLFFKSRRESLDLRRQPYSFSGDLLVRNRHDLRGLRGQYSAPASMRTSPMNSGLLVATSSSTTNTSVSSSTSDSTMEELQAAIQAAIAHCKNSIGSEDKMKC